MIGEEFLCFIWEHKLFVKPGFCTTGGHPLKVVHPGKRNIYAGPDFLDARIRIGSLLWAGNVEVHVRSGQWRQHEHHRNHAFNNVILHVVYQYEQEVINARGQQVHTCVIRIPEAIRHCAEKFLSRSGGLICEPYLTHLHRPIPLDWIRQLGRMRLEKKSQSPCRILADRALSREEALYRLLASGFGLPVNTLPFEWMAATIPFSLLQAQRHSLLDLEAILFGQAGFLSTMPAGGPYMHSLQERYHHFARFFQTGPLPSHVWKFLRLRPASFPTVRIALFASLLHHRIPLSASILEAESLTELEQLFRVKAGDFWDTHFLFQKNAPPAPKFIGHLTFQVLAINVVVPYLRALGRAERRTEYIHRANEWIENVEAESNYIIKKWITFGVRPCNALESQGLLQLHSQYCVNKRCLECKLGIGILEDSMDEEP